jgi:pyruvate formate lyase activating enzyme
MVTGGEPTFARELPRFLHRLKGLGLETAVSTNGSRPDVVRELLATGLLDYIAVDIKGPPEPSRLARCIGVDDAERYGQAVQESFRLVMESGVDHELRMTVVPGLHDASDVLEAAATVRGARRLALQQFEPGNVLNPSLAGARRTPLDQLQSLAEAMKGHFGSVEIRARPTAGAA